MKTDFATIIRQYNLHHIIRHMTLLWCQYTTVTQHCDTIIGQYDFHRTKCHTVVQYAPMTHFSSDRVRQ